MRRVLFFAEDMYIEGRQSEEAMGSRMKPFENNTQREKKEKDKKRSAQLDVLIWVYLTLLSFVGLPKTYKVFAPLLLSVPVILKVVNKIRQSSESSDQTAPSELYYYKPKDPKDPRRYKPIE